MDSPKTENHILSGNSRIDGLYHTVEWLITAFAGTLVFIIFVMQVYRIPTGSMAETLRGAHFRIRCAQCGYRYDYDFISTYYGLPNTVTPSQKMPILRHSPVCPTCGFADKDPALNPYDNQYYVFHGSESSPAVKHTVFKGDQIFVIKSIYQFFRPNRWDVIVFKNPNNPLENYIKRCIGLPGETVQLVDGDVFINGQIARKPAKTQEELWMLLYDNDYQPARPAEKEFYQPLGGPAKPRQFYDRTAWRQPFQNIEDSQWNLQAENGTAFKLDRRDQVVQRLQYDESHGTGFRATYAFDDPYGYQFMPIANDLMLQFHVTLREQSAAGVQIRYRGITYEGWILADGTMRIDQLTDGQSQPLAEGRAKPSDINTTTQFRFSVLDQQLSLTFGSSKLSFDLGTGIDITGVDRQSTPQVRIAGYGSVQLRHIALYRDIHYTVVDGLGRPIIHGSPENPMALQAGQYFACGDNSPASFDSRFWAEQGLANPGREPYRAGIVPHDYLVGKAFFVHWPGGYRPEYEALSRLPILKFLYGIRWIPYVDGMKVIYGGDR